MFSEKEQRERLGPRLWILLKAMNLTAPAICNKHWVETHTIFPYIYRIDYGKTSKGLCPILTFILTQNFLPQ